VRVCRSCKAEFEPNSNSQKDCTPCAQKRIRAAKDAYQAQHREYYRGLSRAWRADPHNVAYAKVYRQRAYRHKKLRESYREAVEDVNTD